MRVLLCLLFAGFACLAPPASAQTNWVSTNWVVSCEEDLEDALGATGCDDTAATGAAAATRAELEAASAWLQGLGFHGPDIETVSTSYRARLSDAATLEMDRYGVYFQHRSKLYINSTLYFAVGRGDTPEAVDRSLARENPKMMTMVHELFHGVQHSYHQGDTYDASTRDWIWEGTAEAVELAWIRTAHPSLDALGGARTWDVPLHRPVNSGDNYDTSHFWLMVGKRLGSPDWVGYLHDVLQADLGPNEGLRGVDAALKTFHPAGLYDLYPGFVARDLKTAYRDHFFSTIPEREIRLSESAPDAETSWTGQLVEPVATSAFNLQVSAPSGTSVGLVVRLRDDHEDLHLIVDGERADRLPFGDDARNVYRATVPVGDAPVDVDVRVANVAPDAVDSEFQTVDIDVEASLVDPCGASQMLATVHRAVVFASPRRPEVFARFGVSDVGSGEMTLGGAGDGGAACTFPLSALTADGAAKIGRATEAQVQASNEARLDGIDEQAQRMDSIASGEMTEADHRAMLEAVNDLQEAMNTTGGSPDDDGTGALARDVVVEVFSPNAWTWRALEPGDPHETKHGGVGGWRPNAASHLVIQLVGTRPEDLEAGETYEAAAFAPAPDDTSDPSVIPTPSGFYARWSGNHTGIRYSEPEMQRQCRQSLRRFAQLFHQQIEIDGADARMAERGDRTCAYRDFAYQGDAVVVSGSLSGSVTIDRITPTVVTGRFDLAGSGTKHVTDYSYRYNDDGEIVGDEEDDSTASIRLQATGTFRAPNGTPGLFRLHHESISVEP